MSENLHRKLADKLRQGSDYPDFSHEEWLALDSRLEEFNRRRRRWGWLWFILPLALLAGLNIFLLLRKNESAASAASLEKNRTTVVFDTILKKVTVYEYDTIYRKTYVTDAKNFYQPFFNSKNTNPAGSQNGQYGGMQFPVQPSDSVEIAGVDNPEDEVFDIKNWPDPDALPYLDLDELPFHKKRNKLVTLTAELKSKIRRKPLLHEAHTGVSAGVTLPQKAGAIGIPGLRFAWENEFAPGQKRLFFWQSLGWQQMRLESREHNAIPGFPLPEKPTPESKLDKIEYSKRDLTAQLGLSWHFDPVKNLRPVLGFGLGGNYCLSAEQTGIFEQDGGDEGYIRVQTPFSTGWIGLSGHARLGLGWEFHRLWELRVSASFDHMLKQQLPDGNIDRWWGLNAGILYRWR